jgi:hypothetical protein
MNTVEFDIVIISTALIDIFSFFEISSMSLGCFSFKCFRNSSSSILLHLKLQDGKIQLKFNNIILDDSLVTN